MKRPSFYRIVEIVSGSAPASAKQGQWYHYVIANEHTRVKGQFCGTRDNVLRHAEVIVEKLNQRIQEGYSSSPYSNKRTKGAQRMKHTQESLPYEMNALEPHLSRETLEIHYGKHHKTYLDNLNNLIVGTPFQPMSLTDIVRKAPDGMLFNNAAQAWNHAFYWKCLQPATNAEPAGPLSDAINAKFGSFNAFKEKFGAVALNAFGSGWAWLVRDANGELEIICTANAANPLTMRMTPLLVVDLWEHAYYVDYRDARATYLESLWAIVNWGFAATNFKLSAQGAAQVAEA